VDGPTMVRISLATYLGVESKLMLQSLVLRRARSTKVSTRNPSLLAQNTSRTTRRSGSSLSRGAKRLDSTSSKFTELTVT
jgi:hypothetical protein